MELLRTNITHTHARTCVRVFVCMYVCMINVRLSAPGPLVFSPFDKCITYDSSDQRLVLAATCNEAMFYYDGEFIREATSHRCISSTGVTDYSQVQIRLSIPNFCDMTNKKTFLILLHGMFGKPNQEQITHNVSTPRPRRDSQCWVDKSLFNVNLVNLTYITLFVNVWFLKWSQMILPSDLVCKLYGGIL